MTKEQVDRDRWAFTKKLTRLGMCGIWRLEFQKRGAPHWHLLVRNVNGEDDHLPEGATGVDAFRQWWGRSYNPSAFGSFAGVRDMGKAGFYLAAHHSKAGQGTWPEWFTGRAWGYVQRDAFLEWVRADEVASDVESYDIVWLHRIKKRFLRSKLAEDRRKAREQGKPLPKWGKRREWRNAGFTWFLREVHHGPLLRLVDNLSKKGPEGIPKEASRRFSEPDSGPNRKPIRAK